MDGWHERMDCGQGEVSCDICESVRIQEEEDMEEPGEEAAKAQAHAMAFVQCRSGQVREGQVRMERCSRKQKR